MYVSKEISVFAFLAYVKSNTMIGDSKHSTGVVMAEIVKGNIPVKNGVVHLIYRPLMVVDNSVKQFLEVRLTFFHSFVYCVLHYKKIHYNYLIVAL